MKIEKETKIDKSLSFSDNLLFNSIFINFLQDNFMPYIFIWAGYVFRCLEYKDKFGNTITHITQGSIEKYFGTVEPVYSKDGRGIIKAL